MLCSDLYQLGLCFSIIAGLYTPDKPTNPRILSVSSQSVKLEWTAPESDGGSPITGCVVIYSFPVADRTLYSRVWVKGQKTNCTLTGRQWSGRIDHFAVAAKNKAGRGEFSDFSSSFTEETGNIIEAVFGVMYHI